MRVQTIVGLVFFIIAAGCALRANLIIGKIVAEINRLLPKEQAVPVYGFVRHRFFDILTEYRRLYPDGKLLLRFYTWGIIGLVCWLACAGCLLFWTVGPAGSGWRYR
jgi:hypothetical protein